MIQLLQGDCLDLLPTLAAGSVQTCVTSPPYFGLRDYGVTGQIGLEATVDGYVQQLVTVFRAVRRVLADDGTLWLNLGDSYFGDSPARSKSADAFSAAWNPADSRGNGGTRRSAARDGALFPKQLIGIPWRVAFALQDDGWVLRADIIWAKPNCMPESVTDRPTKSHEYLFLFAKQKRYYYDAAAIREPATWTRNNNPDWQVQRAETNAKKGCGNRNAVSGGFTAWTPEQGRNKRSVWLVSTRPYRGAHFATFPPDLIRPCILAGSRPGDVVLDPFAGACTTGLVALQEGRAFVGCELNPAYVAIGQARIAAAQAPLLLEVGA